MFVEQTFYLFNSFCKLILFAMNNAFKTILSSLYQKDIIDADADMKVYNMMMKADGIVENEFVKKGSE